MQDEYPKIVKCVEDADIVALGYLPTDYLLELKATIDSILAQRDISVIKK